MKFSNKIIVICMILCAFCIGGFSSLFFRFSKNDTGAGTGRNENSEYAVPIENNISQSVKSKQKEEFYVLKLEGSTISAYIELSDGTRSLWNSSPVPPDLSEKDIATLKKGITTKSFEELCLYYESYLS